MRSSSSTMRSRLVIRLGKVFDRGLSIVPLVCDTGREEER